MLSIQKVICYTGNVVIRTTNSTDDAALGIVGGFNAEKGQYPWFARAVDEKEEPMFCGGTLITSDFILTAGHCTSAELHAYEIGSLCHEEKTNCKQKNERRRVKNILVHPKYEQRADGIRYDFALIKLRGPSSIKPAALDLNGFQSSNTYEAGRELWAVGYGKIDFHDSNFPKHLQHVQVVSLPLRCVPCNSFSP
jgi:secreted trypsin-like serine protease